MKNYDFGDTYGVEAEEIKRQMALAQMIAHRGLSEAPVYSNKAGIAKMLTAVLGGMQMREAEGKMRDLATRKGDSDRAEIANVMTASEGGNANVLARMLAQSSNPQFQQMGLAMALKQKTEEEYGTKPEPGVGTDGKPVLFVSGKRGSTKTLPFAPYEKPEKPEKAPEAVRTFREMLAMAGIDAESPQGKALAASYVQKQSTHQPATTVNVDTANKPLAAEIGGAIGKDFAASRQAAMGAVKGNQVADEAEKLISSGVYSGAGATLKLQAGKVAQAVGMRVDADTIANTEALISNLAQTTLANIRQSGLGGGNGFSNADRDFLQKATGGTIDMTEQGLRRLIDLNRRSNRNVLQSFNSQAAELEKRPEFKGIPLRLGIPDQVLRFDAQGNPQ